MKAYLAMCSLCMLTGATLGHWNGKFSATTDFVDSCDRKSFVVFHSSDADDKRRFHCFEIAPPEYVDEPVQDQRALLPMI